MKRSAALPMLVATLAAQTPSQERPLRGYWQGAATRAGTAIPLSIQFRDSGLEAAVDAPSLEIFGLPATVAQEGDSLEIPFGSWTLALRADAAHSTLRGAMSSRRRKDKTPPQVQLVRVALPGVPAVATEHHHFRSADGTEIAATVRVPPGPGPFPGIVFVQGRSYGGGDASHGSHAVAAARRGIASIVFDGRGVKGSGGERGKHTLEMRLADTKGALTLLRNHEKVDARRVGLYGHSAGGWVVPNVALNTSSVAFLILHASPVEPLAEQQGHVVRDMLSRVDGVAPTDLERAFAYQRRLVELATSGATWTEIQAHVGTTEGESWASHVDRPRSRSDPSLDYFRRNPHDNSRALRSLTIPLLAIYGGADIVASPVHNVPKLRDHLRAANNEEYEIVVYPDAGHGLRIPGRLQQDGSYVWPHVPPDYFDQMFDWILDRVESQ